MPYSNYYELAVGVLRIGSRAAFFTIAAAVVIRVSVEEIRRSFRIKAGALDFS